MTTIKDAINKTPGPKTTGEYLSLYAKSFCMGCADLIPGVSGGTVAFITGIYEDFLGAIASLNKDFITSLLKLDIKGALSKAHVRVLGTMGVGILSAIFSLAAVYSSH